MNTMIIAITSILFSVTAQFSLKAGMASGEVKEALSNPFTLQTMLIVLSNKFVVGGFMLYGLGAVVWLKVLSSWDVSKAYPLVGLGFALTVIAGLIMGEQVTVVRATGVFIICVGVWIVAFS